MSAEWPESKAECEQQLSEAWSQLQHALDARAQLGLQA